MPQTSPTPRTDKDNSAVVKLPQAIDPRKEIEDALTKISTNDAKITRVPTEAGTKPTSILIHLRQMHGHGAMDASQVPDEIKNEMQKYLPTAQGQQQRILDTLAKHGHVKEVFAESLPPSTLEYYEKVIKMLQGQEGRALQAIMQRTKADTPEKMRQYLIANKDSKDPLTQLLHVQAERTWIPLMEIRQELASDFMLRAAYYGTVKLLPGEDEALHKAAIEHVSANPLAEVGENGDPKLNEIQEKRDAYLLSTVTKKNSPVSVVVLGAAHSLREEINTFNKANPSKAIQLIEILPNAVAEFLKEDKD